jgi:hypothetical protein
MEPLKTYRPLSRSLKMPSGAREQGLAVLIVGLAVAAGFGWTPVGERLASIGMERAAGTYAGMVPEGAAGGFRFRGVYLFQDSTGSAFSVLTGRAKPVRTRRAGAAGGAAPAAPSGIVTEGGADMGSVVIRPSAGPGEAAPEGSALSMVAFDTNPFPPSAVVAFDPADPVRARVIGLEDRLWPGIVAGLALAGLGLWMRRRRADGANGADGADQAG